MEYHPEWETPTPEAIIVGHPAKMEKLMRNADFEIAYLASNVKTFLNVNEMIWGWKQPTTDRDHIDLLATVIDKYPNYFRTAGHSGAEHMSELVVLLRDGPKPAVSTWQDKKVETMEDHYQPRYREELKSVKKAGKPDTDNDWTNGNGVDDGDDDVTTSHHTVDTPVYHTPSHTCSDYSHTYSDSGGGDSGGGGGGCD